MKYRTIDEHINHIKDIVENIVENYDSWTEDELEEIAYCLVEEGYTNFCNSYVVVKALEESFEDYYPIVVIISLMDEMIKIIEKIK